MSTAFLPGEIAYILNGHRNGVRGVMVSDVSEERIIVVRGGQSYSFDAATGEAVSDTEWKARPPVLVKRDEPRVLEILRRAEYRKFVGDLQILGSAYAANPEPRLMKDMRNLLGAWEKAAEEREHPDDTIATALDRLGLPDPYRPSEETPLTAPRV